MPRWTSGKLAFTDLPFSPAETSRLRTELADLTKKHTAEIQVLTKDRDHHKAKVKEAQQFGQGKERDLLAVWDELQALQGRTKAWLNEFNKIQASMSRKFLFPSLPRFLRYLPSPHK